MYNSLKSNIIHPVYVYETQNTNFQIKKFILSLNYTKQLMWLSLIIIIIVCFQIQRFWENYHIYEKWKEKKMQENKKKMKNPLFNIIWNGHKLH
jgi:C4-dicarboxylate transporter